MGTVPETNGRRLVSISTDLLTGDDRQIGTQSV
jgi:hypothetical protein